jgi:aryl-alcohol dehydrogenase-like predicted oxidoreductase
VGVSARSTEAIPIRRFGSTDLHVSAFGLGCARIGGVFKSNPAEFLNLLSAAYDGGITFFDTADMYSQGESEKLVGRAFRRRRDRVVIATKAGWVLPRQRQFVARIKPLVRPIVRMLRISRHQLPGAVRGSMVQDFSPDYLRGAIEGSLKRLRTDYIDLLQLHSPPAEVIKVGAFVETLESLKQQGKIRYYGISCDAVDAAHAALRHAGVSSLQVPISALERSFAGVLPLARQQGVAVIARECLANGLLVKQLSFPELRAYCQSDAEATNKAQQLELLRRQATEDGSSLTQLALRFVSQLEGVSVTLLGASRLQQIEALLANELVT